MFAFIIITGKSISRKEEKWHYNTTFKSKNWEDSLVIQWLGLSILCAWVWSLVRKLRSCKLWSKKKERKKISLSPPSLFYCPSLKVYLLRRRGSFYFIAYATACTPAKDWLIGNVPTPELSAHLRGEVVWLVTRQFLRWGRWKHALDSFRR